MLVQNISITYLKDLGTPYVLYLFRGLIHLGIQYYHQRDDCGGKVELGVTSPITRCTSRHENKKNNSTQKLILR
jgi:hypothetical protein